jgi:hypothetical protein
MWLHVTQKFTYISDVRFASFISSSVFSLLSHALCRWNGPLLIPFLLTPPHPPIPLFVYSYSSFLAKLSSYKRTLLRATYISVFSLILLVCLVSIFLPSISPYTRTAHSSTMDMEITASSETSVNLYQIHITSQQTFVWSYYFDCLMCVTIANTKWLKRVDVTK